MANRNLTAEELAHATALLARIKAEIASLAAADAELLFAYTRKIGKELTYFERGKPVMRRKLKKNKMAEQGGLCAVCETALPPRYNVLDRLTASVGYTPTNTRLICAACDTAVQQDRGYR